MSIRIIGCGAPSGDDAVGLIAVRELRQRLPSSAGVEIIEAGTPGLSLLDIMDGADEVFIVDAISSSSDPGTLHEFSANELPSRELFPLSLHEFNIVDALALARVVAPDRLPGQIRIFGVEIQQTTPGEPLTPAVAAAVPLLVARVLGALRQRGLLPGND